jgi:hypothetical protein
MASPTQPKSHKYGLGVAIALLSIAAVAIGFQMSGGRESGAGPVATSAFYTDDNGKTFFKDDVDKLPPFSHNGKQAYRCDVFEDGRGKQFVGLVYRYTESGRREMEGYLPNASKDPDGSPRRAIEERGHQVKPVAASDRAWTFGDDVTTTRLRRGVKDASGKPAKLVQP